MVYLRDRVEDIILKITIIENIAVRVFQNSRLFFKSDTILIKKLNAPRVLKVNKGRFANEYPSGSDATNQIRGIEYATQKCFWIMLVSSFVCFLNIGNKYMILSVRDVIKM